MLTLDDGRKELWQWDTGRKISVDKECSQVHFSNKVFGRSVDVNVVDGIAKIPDVLLQTDGTLNAWAFVGTVENGYTKISKVFVVNRRNKPADYVFTPTDQTSIKELNNRIEKLEANQDPEAVGNAVKEYLENNPIKEEDPTVPQWAIEKEKPIYTADEVGALPKTTKIPSKTSELENDSEFAKKTDVDKLYEEIADLSKGMDLSTLTISVTPIDGGNRLTLNDGTTEKSVDIPAVSVTDEQLTTIINTWLDEHPEATTTIEDGSILYNHISEIEYTGEPTEDEIIPDEGETYVNLFDKDTMIKSGQVWRGVVSAGNGSHAVVPITGGKTYAFHRANATYKIPAPGVNSIAYVGYSIYVDAASLYFYDANDNYLYGVVHVNNYVDLKGPNLSAYEGEATAQIDTTGKGLAVTTTEEVAFVKFSIQPKNGDPSTTDEDTIMLEEGNTCHDYVAYSADSNTSTGTPDTSSQGNLAGCEITGLFGASLADTYARRNLSAMAGKLEGLTGLSDDAIIESGLRKFGYRVEPAQDDIPTVYANGDTFADMTSGKNEVKMSFKYISKTDVFGGWMKIKWQGNLSLSFPKKNFTVKLYGDKTMKHKLKVDLKGWGSQNKFVWKANYIDRSHARNIVSARLWSDMVASRPTYDARMMYSPNHGAVDGFPFRLYVNGEYYGLMTWNIPKDGWMAEMTEDNPNHCILCAEINDTTGTSSCDFAANYNASAWSVEFPDEITPGLIYSFNDIIDCVVNDTDEDFKANIDTHLDLYSALDYYLFFYLNGGTDSLAKNMLLMTYDGVKWYCGAYDMDGVWGRDAVSGAPMSTELQCPEQYLNTNSLLWKRIEACFGQELHDRYFELRETILSKEYIMAKFEQFENQISEEMFTEDYTLNSGMKGVSGSAFLSELSTWLDGRFTYVDNEMRAFNTVTE